MAENLNDYDADAPTEGHNGAPLSEDEIKQAARALEAELMPLEEKRTEINEQIKKARRNFKTTTGVSLRDFDTARRYASMEDDEDRRKKINHLKLAFNGLAPGEQLDWVDAAGAA